MRYSVPKPVLFGGLLALAIAGLVIFRPGGDRKTESQHISDAIADRDFARAGELLDKQISRHDNSPETRLLAADVARRAGREDLAEQHLTAFEKIGGDTLAVTLEREMSRCQKGDVNSSRKLQKFFGENPGHPRVGAMLEALAQGFMTVGRPAEAINALDILLARESSASDRAEWLCWRGESLLRLARGTEGTIDLREAIRLRDDHARARLALVRFLSRDEPVEAMSHLTWLEKHGHRDPETRLELARCHRHLGDMDAAAAVMDELLPIRSDHPDALTEAGAIALARGKFTDAERWLRKAISLKPEGFEATAMLARCLQEVGRETEAAEYLEKAKNIEAGILRRLESQKGKS